MNRILLVLGLFFAAAVATGQPTPSPSASPTLSPSPTVSPSPTRSPTASPSPSPTPRPSTETAGFDAREETISRRVSVWDENWRWPARIVAPLNLPPGGVTVELPVVSGRLAVREGWRQLNTFYAGTNSGGGAWMIGGASGDQAFPLAALAADETAALVVPLSGLEPGVHVSSVRLMGIIAFADATPGTATLDALLKIAVPDVERTGGVYFETLGEIDQISADESAVFDATLTLATPLELRFGETVQVVLSADVTDTGGAYYSLTGAYLLVE